MLYTILEDLIFYQVISFERKFSNYEIKLAEYFLEKVNIYPKCVIIINYYRVKKHLYILRRQLGKKVAIIREQSTLIHLLFSFFPDIFIFDINIENSNISKDRLISIKLLSYEDRAIAIGRDGEYIKAINQLLKKHIIFQNRKSNIKIECRMT
jgi:hypothetical protein